MRNILHILMVAAVVAVAMCSCNTSGCLENRSSLPLAGFYSSETGQAISIDSLTITGIGKADGQSLHDGNTPVQTVYLPMRSTESTTAWQLACRVYYDIDDERYYATVCDTLSFDYDSSPYFASDECGVIYRYQITHMSYTTHMIDSVALTDSLITNTDVERIRIYYK